MTSLTKVIDFDSQHACRSTCHVLHAMAARDAKLTAWSEERWYVRHCLV